MARGKFQGAMTAAMPFGLVHELAQFARGAAHASGLAEADHFAGVVFHEVDGFGHVGLGLIELLAHFEGLPGRKGIDFLARDGGGLEQVAGAVFGREGFPFRSDLFGRLDGQVDFLGGCLADGADDLAWGWPG